MLCAISQGSFFGIRNQNQTYTQHLGHSPHSPVYQD